MPPGQRVQQRGFSNVGAAEKCDLGECGGGAQWEPRRGQEACNLRLRVQSRQCTQRSAHSARRSAQSIGRRLAEQIKAGLEAIAGVPTGGHFFGAEHTLARYETAFYQPMLSNWQNYENWEIAGAQNATQRATAIWQSALESYEQPVMDPAIVEALDAYVARRKEELNAAEH